MMFWTQKMPQKILVLLGPFHTPFWGGGSIFEKKKIKKKKNCVKNNGKSLPKIKK